MLAHPQRSFLASATPAAGKTTFGLHVAHRMLTEGRVGRVCIVAPTTHIARQWAADAARYGLDVEPNRPNAAGPEPRDRHGVAVTYQTLAAGPKVHRRRCEEVPTLILADEPRHMGDQAAWGRSAQAAFERARFRLLLSGTPFRSDNTPSSPPRHRRSRATTTASACATSAVRWSRPSRGAPARPTAPSTRRVNRATGAGSVTEASAEQLERGNRLLERKLG